MYSCFVEVRLNGDDEISVNRHVGCRRITNELLTVLSDRPSEPYRDKSGPLYAFVVLQRTASVTLLCIKLKEKPSKTCSGNRYIGRGSKLSLFLSNTYQYGNKSMQLYCLFLLVVKNLSYLRLNRHIKYNVGLYILVYLCLYLKQLQVQNESILFLNVF